jgi:predicted nucleic-acid-binding Zn-ribbon protein
MTLAGGQPAMPGTLSKCFRCGSTEVESRPIDEFVWRRSYVVALRFVADACANCGEKYLQRSDVSTIEDVRRRLDRGDLDGFRVTGQLLEPAGVST